MPEFQFDSLSDFLAMGGHGVFVWGSYLAFFAVVFWSVWQPRVERKRIIRLLKARNERDQNSRQYDAGKQQAAQQQQANMPH